MSNAVIPACALKRFTINKFAEAGVAKIVKVYIEVSLLKRCKNAEEIPSYSMSELSFTARPRTLRFQ
jgi:hypothetical protein